MRKETNQRASSTRLSGADFTKNGAMQAALGQKRGKYIGMRTSALRRCTYQSRCPLCRRNQPLFDDGCKTADILEQPFIQNRGAMLKNSPSHTAVSAVNGRLPLTRSLMRLGDTSMPAASNALGARPTPHPSPPSASTQTPAPSSL